MSALTRAWLLAVCLLIPSFALGQEGDAPDPDTVEARAHFDRGRGLAEQRRFSEAAEAFRQSLALVDRPTTAYNLALCYYALERYVEAIHALHGGGRVLPPELEALLDAPAAKAPSELLTPREMQVFERLVMGETIKEAAFSLGLSVSTVYTYSDRIRTKLGVRTQPELVRYAASWDLDQR